ncbi:MAG: hypothetical protein KGR98_01685, partial [Verrucomicrobia bacterium]|nr:hypothetical protein [Verrucomicrobiota bacterium]
MMNDLTPPPPRTARAARRLLRQPLGAVFMALAFCMPCSGQTNSGPVKGQSNVTYIDSDSGEFDRRHVIYEGHVRVRDTGMKLFCDRLVADVPPPGGRLSHIVAETNVVIDFAEGGRVMRATGEMAVYDFNIANGRTNDTVTLTGRPVVTGAQGSTAADRIIWDRVRNVFHF